jgi:hypothetical protein
MSLCSLYTDHCVAHGELENTHELCTKQIVLFFDARYEQKTAAVYHNMLLEAPVRLSNVVSAAKQAHACSINYLLPYEEPLSTFTAPPVDGTTVSRSS